MATFSVDITDVVFAGARTGHKDITITGMPAGGVAVSLIGPNPTYFTCINNPESKGTNVYRASTKSTNKSSGGSDRTAGLRIVNKSDSTDYVTVSLKQIHNRGKDNVYTGSSSYSDIYTTSSGWGFFPYSLSDSTSHIEVLVDGYTEYTKKDSWVSVVAETTYTDTGFKKLLVSCNNNYDGPRIGNIYLGGNSADYADEIKIFQNGYPSSTSGCTQSLSFLKSGGTQIIELKIPSQENVLNVTTTQELSSFNSPSIERVSDTRLNFSLTIGNNNTGSDLRGLVFFNAGSASNYAYLGHTIINQAGAEAASLTISPTGASVGSAAGTTTVTVTSTGIDTVECLIEEGWVSLKTQSSNVYTFSYTANTSSSQRSCIITFYGGGLSKTFVINQAAGAISVSPVSSNVGNTSGTIQVTVTGSSNITYSISGSWLTYQSKSGNVYTFAYTQNSSSSQRTATVTFSASGMTNGVFTLTQDAASAPASLTISPTSNSVSSSSGSVQITVTSSGISDVQYSISDSWITYGGKSGNVYTFNYSSKTSTGQRIGTITFSGGGITETYTLTQEGASAPASLSISPTRKTVSGATGRIDITVNQTGIDDLQYTFSANSGFVFSHKEGNVYVFSYERNTSTLESRTASITFSGAGLSETFTLYQQPQSTTKSLNLIPTSDSVDAGTGYVYVTVSVNRIGYNQYSRSINGSWLSYVSSAGYIDKYSYRRNSTSEERTATVTYTGGGLTKTYTLTQEGTSPDIPKSFKVYPKKLRYYGEGGGMIVSFTNRPEGGIDYEITYIDGSDWLSVGDYGPNKYVSATENSGIRRRASIRFYDVNDTTNYVIVQVIQGNIDGYNSIWMDDLYYPESRDDNGNYYYRLVNHKNNAEYFEGVSTKPTNWGGEIGGIDIPRLIDGHLHSLLLSGSSSDWSWSDMLDSYLTVDIYNMTENGYPGVVDATFKYYNDWSRFEKRYDYTRSLNDPINGKGCDNMIIPFCVYYDDTATFSIVDTEKNGNVNTYTLSKPSTPFAMRTNSFYDTKKLEYKQDDEVIFSYDMDHCGQGAFIYRNRFGGWDSFLIEGNIIKTDNYTKLNWRRKGEYNQGYAINTLKYIDEKVTDSVNIDTTYQAYTGWLSDEEAERLVFHLLSSPIVYFQNLHKENQVFDTDPLLNLMPIRITTSSAEYKKFRNGKKLINYLITFEKSNTEKVRD